MFHIHYQDKSNFVKYLKNNFVYKTEPIVCTFPLVESDRHLKLQIWGAFFVL